MLGPSRQEIERAVQRFEIGEPLRSLFQPMFSVYDGENYSEIQSIRLSINVPDSSGSGKKIIVAFVEEVPFYATGSNIFTFLRRTVHKMLEHEADEAIRVDGIQVYDPHRGEKQRG